MNNQIKTNPFIDYLKTLSEDDRRKSALASLRRGLGKPLGTDPSSYRYVVPWLSANFSKAQENAYFLVAALFALHPGSSIQGNLGEHLGKIRQSSINPEAIDRRFSALLSCHSDDLPVYLRQMISLLKSKEIDVNWGELLDDIVQWNRPDRRIQKKWARGFWGRFENMNETNNLVQE